MLRIVMTVIWSFAVTLAWADTADLTEATRKAMEQAERTAAASREKTRKALEQAERGSPYERTKTRKALEQAEQGKARVREKTREAFQQVESGRVVAPELPKVDLMKLPQVQVDPKDLGQMVRQGQALYSGTNRKKEDRYPHRVLIFVSSSMPLATVRNYLEQAAVIDAALVFRGFKGNTLSSMKAYVAELLEERVKRTQAQSSAKRSNARPERQQEPTILIDPTLYRRFGIQQVPVIVATEGSIQPCPQQSNCPPPEYHAVRGDVALGWALTRISGKAASDELRAYLKPLIRQIRG